MPRAKLKRHCLSFAALVAVLWAAPLASQQSPQLTVTQVRQIAVAALQNRDPGVAADASNALLARDPNDVGALLLRTQASVLADDYAGALSFGRRAFRNADNNNQRYSAARLVAISHARQEQFSRAQIWLRVARQFAPNDEATAEVANQFRQVRSLNPLSVNLRFGIRPTTNVNNGTSNETITLFGLDGFVLSEDAQALSGFEISGGANLRYRLRTDQTSATFFDVNANGRTFVLTENAEDSDGDSVRGSDFSDASLSFGLTHRFLLSPTSRPTTAGLSVGQRWLGGEANSRFFTATVSHSYALSDVDTLSVSGFAQRQDILDGGDVVRTYSTRSAWTRDLSEFGTVSFSLGLRDSQSSDTNQDFDSISYGVSYSFPEPIFGVDIGVNYSFEERDFSESTFDPVDGRNDDINAFTVRAVLTDIEYFGFQPVVTFERRQQRSNIELFDRDFTNFGFDIASSF